TAAVYQMAPTVDTATLTAAQPQAAKYLAGPLTLKTNSRTETADLRQVADWIDVSGAAQPSVIIPKSLAEEQFYPPLASANITLNEAKIKAFVADMATRIDQPGQNAALSIEDGRAVVFQPSRDGFKLDQAATLADIKGALNQPATARTLTLSVAV